MHSQSFRPATNVCLRCQWRLLSRPQNIRWLHTESGNSPTATRPLQRRSLHAVAAARSQNATVPANTAPGFDPSLVPHPQQLPFRKHLTEWQQQYGGPSEEVLSAFENHPARRDVRNGVSKLSTGLKADEDANERRWDEEEDDDGEELITIGLFLKPGDVVELSQPGREPVLAVFVQQFDNNSQFFSANGRWCHCVLAQISFAITGCIDPAQLQPLFPYLPTSPSKAKPKGEVQVPSELAAPVQQMLKRMAEEAEKIYRANAPVLDTAYASLADSTRTRMMTLTQIAKSLLGRDDPDWKPSPAALLAVRKSLNHNQFRFRSDKRSHRMTNVFAIRPKNDVEVVDTVQEWFREYQEHLANSVNRSKNAVQRPSKGASHVADFIVKARRLIARSRQDREPHDTSVGPSKARMTDPERTSSISIEWDEIFSGTDKHIINFLSAWVLTAQYGEMPSYQATCFSLVMATGCYETGTIRNTGKAEGEASHIDRATGYLFLQEIGVISPFENRAIYDEQLMLPTVRSSRNIDLLHAKVEQSKRKPDFKDSMADLRRDWGSTTIYCIDDPGAQEIDDGVSIERVINSASVFWVHVHVANPTAFFDKTHALSGLAAHMTESIYTPERSYPMLPSWASQGYFSLKSNRPVLTFSSKIDADGEILDIRIQPGIVRNIVTLSPSDVSAILGEHEHHETTTVVVGGTIPANESAKNVREVNGQELQDLRDLYTAAQALWKARRAAGGIRIGHSAAEVRVFDNPKHSGLAWLAPSLEKARFIKGDPVIQLKNRFSPDALKFKVNSSNIVEEMMLLACKTAAAWCTERGIPVMYRGTIDPPNASTEASADFHARHILPYYEKHGKISRKLAYQYISSLGRAIAHTAPLPHKIIGVPSYVKVTSPLRRFSDMISHWQIEAAIRYEAQSGKKLKILALDGTRQGILPFNQRQIRESIITLSPREKLIRNTKSTSLRYWMCSAMMRALQHKEVPLPETFRFWVKFIPEATDSFWKGAQGVLPDYGIEARLIEASDVQLGDEWEVKIKQIHMFAGAFYVTPVRLIHRDDDLV